MSRRTLMMLIMSACAVGGPYALHNDNLGELLVRVKERVARSSDSSAKLSVENSGSISATGNENRSVAQLPASSTQAPPQAELYLDYPITDLRQAFDFNITPNWIMQRWPRISTGLSELDMRGMRVALVTGTNVDDLHGSLTYYFDRNHRLQRITFDGHTADARRLVDLVTRYHGLKAQQTLDAALYVKTWNKKPKCVLWIGHSPLALNKSATTALQVKLEINRTDGPFRLSAEMQSFFAAESS